MFLRLCRLLLKRNLSSVDLPEECKKTSALGAEPANYISKGLSLMHQVVRKISRNGKKMKNCRENNTEKLKIKQLQT